MAGDPPTDANIVRPRSLSLSNDHLKALSTLTLLLTDAIVLVVAFVVSYEAREFLPFFARPQEQPNAAQYLPTIILHTATVIVMFYFAQLYHQKRAVSRIDQLRTVMGVVTLGALLASSIQEFLLQNTSLETAYPRSLLFYVWFFSVVLTVIGREVHRRLWTQLRKHGVVRDNLLIVGDGNFAREITSHIRNSPELGYAIVGIVTAQPRDGDMLGYAYIGAFDDIPRLIDDLQVEQVIVALTDYRRNEVLDIIALCQRGKVDIKVYPDMFAYVVGDLNVDDLGGMALLTVRDIALRGWKLSLKRAMDLFGAGMGLILLSPLMLLTALMIRLESRGSVFYSQVRMGLDGRPFPMIKFRSMKQDAETNGRTWTIENDERVTRLGRFMRGNNWDEIPQLINVLLGQMSLVGPRPERPMYVQQFRQQIPDYIIRQREKAGMTGWAQVNGMRGDTSIALRTEFDRHYVENWSLWLDFVIIIRTLWQTITRSNRNAY